MKHTEYFIRDNGMKLPVSVERYLTPVLSPTSAGTNYWDPPPPMPASDRQHGRILLQVHQMLEMFRSLGVELRGKRLLDIGTGNGLVPRLLLDLSDLKEAVGADPYLDGEHKTSWQPHDYDESLRSLREFIDRAGGSELSFEAYRSLAKIENMSFQPRPIALPKRIAKPYRFAQVGAHELGSLGEEFDLFYCKAIEHIPDWEGVFASVARTAASGAVFYLKHRPFFSYLGAHRYASVGIPWGHVLLTDSEFRRYCDMYHSDRANEMCNFFFDGLAYPRYSVTDMLRIAQANGFTLLGVQYEPPRYISTVSSFIFDIDGFWQQVWGNYPRVSADELFSGIAHVVLKRTH